VSIFFQVMKRIRSCQRSKLVKVMGFALAYIQWIDFQVPLKILSVRHSVMRIEW
jgi:hypothetical protein